MMPARFAQTNLGAVGFHREITLLDGATVEMPKIRRQSFQQEFPLDLTRDFAVAGLKVAGHNPIFSCRIPRSQATTLRIPCSGSRVGCDMRCSRCRCCRSSLDQTTL